MPEGDTIHRTAARLRPALVDRELVRFEAPRLTTDRPQLGDRIHRVEAVGKNLLMHVGERGLVLLTHMKMTGAWHLYRPGERWQKGRHLVRCLVGVDDWVAVCFAAPVVRTYYDLPTVVSPIAHLGPDLCDPDADIDDAVNRLADYSTAETELADALLDQRVACGIGNVFKSEALWARRLSPFAPVSSLSLDDRRRLLTTAAQQLKANLAGGPRRTVPGGLAVYGRRGQPCRSCGTAIEMKVHGAHHRSTYWCPQCQPARDRVRPPR